MTPETTSALIRYAAAVLEEGDRGDTITLAELRELLTLHQDRSERGAFDRLLKAIEHAVVRGDLLEEIEKGR